MLLGGRKGGGTAPVLRFLVQASYSPFLMVLFLKLVVSSTMKDLDGE